MFGVGRPVIPDPHAGSSSLPTPRAAAEETRRLRCWDRVRIAWVWADPKIRSRSRRWLIKRVLSPGIIVVLLALSLGRARRVKF